MPFFPGRLRHASLAAGTGVETADEVIKYLLAGADAVMTASALLRHGPGHLRSLVAGVDTWLSARGFASVTSIKGLMRASHPEAEAKSTNAPIISRLYRAIRVLMSATDRRYGCFCATCYGRQPSRKWPRALSDWILSQMILVIANIARRIVSREKWSPIKKGPPMDQQAAYVAAIDGPVEPLKN